MFEGRGRGQRGKLFKNAVFLGKRSDNKILKVRKGLSRNFVVIAQAPRKIRGGLGFVLVRARLLLCWHALCPGCLLPAPIKGVFIARGLFRNKFQWNN